MGVCSSCGYLLISFSYNFRLIIISLSATAGLKSMLASVLQLTTHCIDNGSAVSYCLCSVKAMLIAFVSSVQIAQNSGQRNRSYTTVCCRPPYFFENNQSSLLQNSELEEALCCVDVSVEFRSSFILPQHL